MANAVFSPKDFKAYVILEGASSAVNGNGFASGEVNPNAPAITSNLLKLNVDSISFPSFNVNQAMEVRAGDGRVAKAVDFFHDNRNSAVEISVSGVLSNTAGHNLLIENIMGNTDDPVAMPQNHTGSTGQYGVTSVDNATFTTVLASPDQSDGYNIVLRGCLCSNFVISADMGDGGIYRFDATITSGLLPILENVQAPAEASGFVATPISLSTATAKTVNSVTSVMQNFNVTIDSPVVYAGVSNADGYKGFESFARGAETSVTASSTIKLDSATRGILSNFHAGTVDTAGSFTLTQGTASNYSLAIARSALTNVAYNEGDIMMLDVEMKALAHTGAESVLTIDKA
tara:strand:- start:16567 stop:17601 length:1035 start_codon:yes stop_codon:yes gene_type:complete